MKTIRILVTYCVLCQNSFSNCSVAENGEINTRIQLSKLRTQCLSTVMADTILR